MSSRNTSNDKNLTLSIALPENYLDIVQLVLSMVETEGDMYEQDNEKLAEKIGLWMSYNPCFTLVDPTDKVVGVMFLDTHSYEWTKKERMYSPVTYIKPAFRSLKAFKTLLEAAEEYAKIKGVEFDFTLVQVKDLDVKEKLLERLGYKRTGSMYTKV